MTDFVPDFGEYFSKVALSDVDISIVEKPKKPSSDNNGDDEALSKHQNEGARIPGHSMVLAAFSNYCKTQLQEWNSQLIENAQAYSSGSMKRTVLLPVPPGQTVIATKLVQGMYEQQPDFSDMTQQQLLDLMVLADEFEVPKVKAAVLNVFKAMPAVGLEWDTALALLQLPTSCTEQSTCKQILPKVTEVARQKLLTLGDLEAVWADPQLSHQLLQMPHAALLYLLQHDETQVADESTVVYTILQWWEQQQQDYKDRHLQHLQQLMQQVRVQHLSQMYICTNLMNNHTVLLCYTVQELGIACLLANSSDGQKLRDAGVLIMNKFSAWSKRKRPSSQKQLVVIEWNLQLTDLADIVKQAVNSKQSVSISSPRTVIRGQTAQIKATVSVRPCFGATCASSEISEPAEKHVLDINLNVSLTFAHLPEGAVCTATFRIIVEQTEHPSFDAFKGHASACYPPTLWNDMAFAHGGRTSVGGSSIVLGRVDSSVIVQQAKSAVGSMLRDSLLLHADDCMHISAYIYNVS